MNILDIIKNI